MFRTSSSGTVWLVVGCGLCWSGLLLRPRTATAQHPSRSTARSSLVVAPLRQTKSRLPGPVSPSRGAPGPSGFISRGPIEKIDIDITPRPGPVPMCLTPASDASSSASHRGARGRPHNRITFCWKSPGLYHFPLYFADDALERHGRTQGLSSVHSGVHFFSHLAVLPLQWLVPSIGASHGGDPDRFPFPR